MTMDAGQIDYIVREVMRQLTSQSQSPPVRTPPIQSSPAVAEPTLVIDDRVVTTARLRGQLAAIKRVRVTPQAVVTPLVADFLREQGIQLERQADQTPTGDRSARTCGLVAEQVLADRILGTLSSWGLRVQRLGDFSEALSRLSSGRTPTPQRTVVLTPAWAMAVCQINRQSPLQAAALHCVEDVRDACQQLDLNVAVIDANRLTQEQLLDVIGAYCECVGLLGHLLPPERARAASLPTQLKGTS